jgi:hypothetical protein
MFYNSVNSLIEKNEKGGACSTVGEQRHVQGFGGKPVVKRPMGRPRCRWKNNIKMDLQEVGCGSMDWIELAQETGGGHW